MAEQCEILTVEEASKFLKIGKKTLYNLASRGLVPARKIGREWRFIKSLLIDWVQKLESSQKPCWEIKRCPKKKKNKCKVYKSRTD